STCDYGLRLWLSNLCHSVSKVGNFGISLIATIPYIVTAVLIVLLGVHSDLTITSVLHLACAVFSGHIALWSAALANSSLAQSPETCWAYLEVSTSLSAR